MFFCDPFDECTCLESVYVLPFGFQVSNGTLVSMMILLMHFLGLISIAYWGPRFGIFICSFVSCFMVRFIIRGCPVVGVSCCSLVPRFSFDLPSSILILSCKFLYFNSIMILCPASIFDKACSHIPSNMVAPSRCIRYNCWLKCCFRLYRNLISWLILYFIACCVVLVSLVDRPLEWILMYLGCSPLALHILLNKIAALLY